MWAQAFVVVLWGEPRVRLTWDEGGVRGKCGVRGTCGGVSGNRGGSGLKLSPQCWRRTDAHQIMKALYPALLWIGKSSERTSGMGVGICRTVSGRREHGGPDCRRSGAGLAGDRPTFRVSKRSAAFCQPLYRCTRVLSARPSSLESWACLSTGVRARQDGPWQPAFWLLFCTAALRSEWSSRSGRTTFAQDDICFCGTICDGSGRKMQFHSTRFLIDCCAQKAGATSSDTSLRMTLLIYYLGAMMDPTTNARTRAARTG